MKDFGQLEVAYKKVIGYSDIDFNGHLNNSKYVDYIMDCFPVAEHKKHSLRSVDLNFMHEALPGDTLILLKDVSKAGEGIIYIEGVNEKDNHAVFRSRITID